MARYTAEHFSADELTALQDEIESFVKALAATADVHALSVYQGSPGTPAEERWYATIIWSQRTPIRPSGAGVGAIR